MLCSPLSGRLRPRILVRAGACLFVLAAGDVARAADPVALPLIPQFVNDNGIVAGFNYLGQSGRWLFNTATNRAQELTGKYKGASLQGLNNSNDVCGYSWMGGIGYNNATYWPAGGAAQTPIQGKLLAINNARVAVGWTYGTNGNPGGKVIHVVPSGSKLKVTQIGVVGQGLAINSSGVIAVNDYSGIYLWTPTVPNGTSGARGPYLEGSSPNVYSLNDSRVSAGDISVDTVDLNGAPMTSRRAAIWNNTTLSAAGVALPGVDPQVDGYSISSLYSVNAGGVAVGYSEYVDAWGYNPDGTAWGTFARHAIAWIPGQGLVDLNSRFSDPRWVLTSAYSINTNGLIVGEGLFNGVVTGFLLQL